MRFCLNCHHLTIGQPLYCNSCGSSFDAKLCPSRHVNPRTAEVCAQCGSRDLSTPAPRVPFWLTVLVWLAPVAAGLVLILISILLFLRFLARLINSEPVDLQGMLLALAIGILWLCYFRASDLVKDLFRSVWRNPRKKA